MIKEKKFVTRVKLKRNRIILFCLKILAILVLENCELAVNEFNKPSITIFPTLRIYFNPIRIPLVDTIVCLYVDATLVPSNGLQ